MSEQNLGGGRKLTIEASDEADKKAIQEFARLRRSKQVTDEEKMYMDMVEKKGRS